MRMTTAVATDVRLMAHLMRRAAFGASTERLEELAERGFDKRLKYPTIQLQRLRSRRVVTQQNKFQNLFATVLVAITPRSHHVVQGVATAVIAAAR